MTERPTPLVDNPATGYRSHYAEHEHNRKLARTLERDRAELMEALREALGHLEACEGCDLIYDACYAYSLPSDDKRTVADFVRPSIPKFRALLARLEK